MNDSVTIQDLKDALILSMREVKDLRVEIAKLTTLLEQEKYKSEQLDKGWNKTIDAHEVTKQRLLKYENEAGVSNNDYASLLGDAFALLNSNEGSTYSFEAQKKELLSKICNLR
tara:strand:- start:38 stop:379 length:342 start_codon:yes stop_codon:yes gene_type:complete